MYLLGALREFFVFLGKSVESSLNGEENGSRHWSFFWTLPRARNAKFSQHNWIKKVRHVVEKNVSKNEPDFGPKLNRFLLFTFACRRLCKSLALYYQGMTHLPLWEFCRLYLFIITFRFTLSRSAAINAHLSTACTECVRKLPKNFILSNFFFAVPVFFTFDSFTSLVGFRSIKFSSTSDSLEVQVTSDELDALENAL